MKNNITASPQDSLLPKYKDRKLKAIKLQQEGKTLPEIAGILNVSIRTVQRYFKNDFEDISSHRRSPGNQYKLTKDQLNQVKLVISKSAKKSSFLFSEWTPRMLVQYVQDEFDISISKEKARQILKYNIRQPKYSDVQLNKKIESWKEVETKDVWILGHLYLGTQNRDGKFKSGKKPYVDDDLLKTLAEIERDKIDLSKKSMPQIALCAIGLQTKRVSCTFLEPSIDEKEQVEAFIIKVIENSKKRNIVFLTTKSSIIGRNAESLRYLSTKKNVHFEFLPFNSAIFHPIQKLKISIMRQFSLFDHTEMYGIKFRSSKASEFKKTTRDRLLKHFLKISDF